LAAIGQIRAEVRSFINKPVTVIVDAVANLFSRWATRVLASVSRITIDVKVALGATVHLADTVNARRRRMGKGANGALGGLHAAVVDANATGAGGSIAVRVERADKPTFAIRSADLRSRAVRVEVALFVHQTRSEAQSEHGKCKPRHCPPPPTRAEYNVNMHIIQAVMATADPAPNVAEWRQGTDRHGEHAFAVMERIVLVLLVASCTAATTPLGSVSGHRPAFDA